MKTAKRIILSVLLIFVFSVVSADSNLEVHFQNIHGRTVLPVDSEIGLVYASTDSETHGFLFDALSAPFDFDWTEKWFEDSMKQSLSSAYSSILSQILPADGFLMSKKSSNSDGSCSIAVKFKNGNVLIFTFEGEKIVGIN